jgi:hypothetical protein
VVILWAHTSALYYFEFCEDLKILVISHRSCNQQKNIEVAVCLQSAFDSIPISTYSLPCGYMVTSQYFWSCGALSGPPGSCPSCHLLPFRFPTNYRFSSHDVQPLLWRTPCSVHSLILPSSRVDKCSILVCASF